MWRTNLQIGLVVIATLGLYTLVANVIPQVESDVPEEVEVEEDMTQGELVDLGEEIFTGAGGCQACHGTGARAPDVLGVAGTSCEERVAEMGCREYLHESLVDPGAFVVEGFEPIMPDVSRTLGEAEIWALVAFLESQGGEVTVTPDLIEETDDEPPALTGAGDEPPPEAVPEAVEVPAGQTDPEELFRSFGCLSCHVVNGEGSPVGPAVDEIRAAGRDREEIRESILDPLGDTVPGYEAVAGTMPVNFGERMTAGQLEAIVRYLAEED